MSQLWVSATNLVNNGSLIGDSAGEIRLTGVNMDLSLGSVEIGGIAESGGRGPASWATRIFGLPRPSMTSIGEYPNVTC